MNQAATSAPARAPAPAASSARLPLILVTGLSGAGHSTALRALEDLGYEAVDNLPLTFLTTPESIDRPMAIAVDSRTRGFSPQALLERIERLRADPALKVSLVFLTCSDEVLQRRYTETRRRHPLAQDRPVADGIRQERLLLDGLSAAADLVIDSSDLAIADLKRLMQGHFGLERQPGLAIAVMSFSYRHGLPREADLVFDVRFLSNPHYRPELRDLTGRDAAVGRHVEADPAFGRFFGDLTDMLVPLLPGFEREGKSYLTLAVGCTGGRHRSVFVAERLAAWLTSQGRPVSLRHRDIARPDDA
ncbi:MAG TPA: RNase adapter RapZ [Candidatus Polarisedimenticolia bacterium]|nr:RNase adapter RapZ [Candidatus Polarisedimenticolia bacterium]